jgi:transposase-like protein
MAKYRKYSKEFKLQATRLVTEQDSLNNQSKSPRWVLTVIVVGAVRETPICD